MDDGEGDVVGLEFVFGNCCIVLFGVGVFCDVEECVEFGVMVFVEDVVLFD